ncbi:MAG: response regulator transcription factor [Turicibacter sp.]|nr:response regulator transcription factor [Turicibacter sp.]
MKNKILLLEDDQLIAGGLIYALEQEGYLVTHVKSVEKSKQHVSKNAFDLAILDMQLPDGLGTEVQGFLQGTGTHVLFLTVVDDEGNIVKAFEDGAEDYITKPFRLRELLARIKRILLKNGDSNLLQVGTVRIDTESAKVYLGEMLLELTALEYRLLLIFATNRRKVMTRTQILDHLWDASGNFVEDNTLSVYIKRLRGKLGSAMDIQTIRGLGYRVD